MLRLAVIFVLLVLGKTQIFLGVDFSFDVDFYRNFESARCDNESAWRIVEYGSVNVELPPSNSYTGIQAAKNSCASSFPIFFYGGTLEFDVYVRALSQSFRISIEVYDEDDTLISQYRYGRSSDGFEPGWQIIYLKVDKYTKGYINIRGTSLMNEIVLVDSFRYIPAETIKREYTQNFDIEKEVEEEMLYDYPELNNQFTYTTDQDSTDVDYDSGEESSTPDPTTDVPTEQPIVDPGEDNTFWNPFTIFFVCFGASFVVAIIAVGAYYYGKVRAIDNAHAHFFNEEIEPPRTITIPRVTGVNENQLGSMIFER